MADDPNRLEPDPPVTAARPGDAPDAVLRRYLTDRRGGSGLGYYRDAVTREPAFRDTGGRLSTRHNDPQVIGDLVAIAEHRGWTAILVRGEVGFRREAWLRARQAGLEVKGYRPSERDLQDLQRRQDGPRRAHAKESSLPSAAASPLAVVERVVAARVADPQARARIVERAESRLRQWLDRGAVLADRRPEATRER